MADLTSRYRKQELRDISMQACVTAIENGYKEFPENYYSGKFTDFLDIQGGTQPPKSKFVFEERNGYIRFLQIRDFSSESTLTYIPIDNKNKLCEKDDILLGRYGASVGKILTGKAGAYNVACAKVIILDKKAIDKDFLFFLLHSLTIQNAIQNISRSAQGGFNKGDLSKIEIVIPKIEWQKKLLSVLFGIDEFLISNSKLSFLKYKEDFLNYLISLFQKRLGVIKEIEGFSKEIENQQTHLQILRQAILQEAVQGKLSEPGFVGLKDSKMKGGQKILSSSNLKNHSADNENAATLLQRIKAEKQKIIAEGKLKKEKELPPITEEEIPFELPKGWVWCRLGEIALNVEYGTSEKAFSHGEVPVLRMGNVQNSEIIFSNLKYVRKSIKDLPKLFLKNKDLVFNRTNSFELVGKCGVYYGQDDEYTLASYLIRVGLPLEFVSAEYVNYYINSKICRETQIEPEITQQTGQANFSGSKLKNILFPLPPLSEQHRIVAKVQQLLQMVNQLEQQVANSQAQAGQLLQAVLKSAFAKAPADKGGEYAENEMITMAAEE